MWININTSLLIIILYKKKNNWFFMLFNKKFSFNFYILLININLKTLNKLNK